MWAIGFALVQQRQGGLLKRFIASPMKRWRFLVSQILARLRFLALEASVLLAFARFLLDVPLRVQTLPLTALNDALRAVMLDGAGFAALAPELGRLALGGTVAFAAALKLFRWQ